VGCTLVALADAAHYFAQPSRWGLTGAPDRMLGGGYALYDLYETAEGWIAVAGLERHFRDTLLAQFPGDASERARLTAGFRTRRADEWHAWAESVDLPIVAVRRTRLRAGFAAWLLVVLVPSSNQLWFSGLPLATWPEWVAVALLVPIAFSKRLARRLVDDSPRRWLTTRRLTSAALLALGLKFLVAMTTSHVGFAACYTSPMAAPVRGRCETTFSYPFSDGRYTRYEATIDRRGPGWQLAFLNHLRLIPADAEAPARDLEAFAVFDGYAPMRPRGDGYSGTAERWRSTVGTGFNHFRQRSSSRWPGKLTCA
jgi:hypothetical protein